MRKRVAISCFLAGLTFGMPAAHSQNVPVTNGLRLWLDATDSNTLYKDTGLTQLASAGDDVVGWKDKSGNSFDATAPFLAPTLQSDAMNGRAALRFEGSAGAGMLIDDGLYIDRPYSIFVVNQFYGGVGRTLQSYSTNWLLGGWSGSVANYAVNGFVGSVPADQNVVYVADTTGEPDGNSTFHVNNYDATNNQAPNGAPGNLGLVSVGSFAGEGANADISEVLVYDHVLADNELSSRSQNLSAGGLHRRECGKQKWSLM